MVCALTVFRHSALDHNRQKLPREVASRDVRWSKFVGTGKERNGFLSSFFPVPVFSRSFPRTSLLPASNHRSSLNTCWIQILQDTTDAYRRELFVAKNRIEKKCLMTKISARKVGSRDVRWSKFVGAGKERTRFLSSFFPVPVFARSFPRTSLVASSLINANKYTAATTPPDANISSRFIKRKKKDTASVLPLDCSAIQPSLSCHKQIFWGGVVVNPRVHQRVLCGLYSKRTDRWFPVVDSGLHASESSMLLVTWGCGSWLGAVLDAAQIHSVDEEPHTTTAAAITGRCPSGQGLACYREAIPGRWEKVSRTGN